MKLTKSSVGIGGGGWYGRPTWTERASFSAGKLLGRGGDQPVVQQHDVAVAGHQLEDQPRFALDAEARRGAEREHQHPVAASRANREQPHPAQRAADRPQPAWICRDRQLGLVERHQRRRAERIDGERRRCAGGLSKGPEAQRDAAVVQQPGVGHATAAQGALEFRRRAADQHPIGGHRWSGSMPGEVLSGRFRICPCLRPVREEGGVLTGPGLLFVVSGPSGAGKDTLVEGLKARHERLLYSVSATTRAPREGERDNVDYFFVTRAEFERRIAERAFLEWREYNGSLYGMPRSFIEEKLRDGYDIVAKPEVNGALAIKEQFPDAVLIFIVPGQVLAPALAPRDAAHRDERTDRRAARDRARRVHLRSPVRLSRDQRGSPPRTSGGRPRGDRAGRTVPHPSRPRHPSKRIGRHLTHE